MIQGTAQKRRQFGSAKGLMKMSEEFSDYIPNEVVGLMVKKRYNTVKAWRLYLGLTQKEIAKKAGITQVALSQMEKTENEMRTATLEKLAGAIGLNVEQLQD